MTPPALRPFFFNICGMTIRCLFAILCVLLLTSCQSPAAKIDSMSPKEQRIELAQLKREVLIDALREMEEQSPTKWVEIKNPNVSAIRETVQRETLFRNAITRVTGHKFTGRIQSESLVAQFKDFEIQILYLASNGSEISRENFTIYKTCGAGKAKSFSVEIQQPNQTSNYKYLLLGALPAN